VLVAQRRPVVGAVALETETGQGHVLLSTAGMVAWPCTPPPNASAGEALPQPEFHLYLTCNLLRNLLIRSNIDIRQFVEDLD
jgi:hypothetical protein